MVAVICLEKHASVLLVSEPLNRTSLKTGTTKPKLLGVVGALVRLLSMAHWPPLPNGFSHTGHRRPVCAAHACPWPLAPWPPLRVFSPPWVHPLSPPEDAKDILAASQEEPTAFSDPLGSPPSHGHGRSGYAVPSEDQVLFVF